MKHLGRNRTIRHRGDIQRRGVHGTASRRLGTLLAATAIAALIPFGAGAGSLSDTIQLAIGTHPDVQEASANRRATEAELREARGLYYPRLDVRGAVGPEWTKNTISAPNGKWLLRGESSATLSQLLFNGFAREGEVDKRASRVDAASYRVRERSEVIALNTTQAYLDVLRNNEIVELGRDNVEVHERIKADVRSLVDDGAKGIGDLQQAEARVASAKDSLIRAEKDRDDAVANYIRIVGEEPRDLIRPELPDEAVPPSVEAAVVQSLNNNPAVRAVAAEIDVAHGERRVVEGDFYPTMSLEVAGSANDNLDGVRGPNHDFTALLRFELNIFKGGIDEARRMEAVERIGEARARVLALQRIIEEQVRLAWIATESAKRESVVLNDQVLANSQVVSTYRQEFEIGQRDLLDLLDSENELFLSRTRLITADYTALFGKYSLLADTGELLNNLDMKVPEEASTGFRKGAAVDPDWKPGRGLTKK